ncbi:MAG: hypothetical protein KDJ88_01195 [Bauldia sp.]|nr:hypothetical protein [Bauldia sp.]
MYARLLTFNIGPGGRDLATGMADEAYAMVKAMGGFISATYLVIDETAGDYGSLTVWNSHADADAAADVLRPWMMEKAGDRLTAPPAIHTCEIYQPK